MTGSIPPAGPLAYEGQVVVPFIMRTFSPQSTFNQFPVPTIWINTAISKAWILVSKALGVAIWAPIGGSPGEIDTITTPDGTVVVPIASNINFLNGSGINITGATNQITFSAVGGGITWVDVSTTSASMQISHGYAADNGSLVTLTLPATANFGDVIGVTAKNTGGWLIAQNSGQTVQIGKFLTTSGIGGSLASTQKGDTVYLLCTTANTNFQVLSMLGDITYV